MFDIAKEESFCGIQLHTSLPILYTEKPSLLTHNSSLNTGRK